MTIQAATPYLILNGKTKSALSLYERALGGKTESLQRFGDVDGSCPEARKDLVMHAVLRVGAATLMMSDGGPGPGEAAEAIVAADAKVSVALDFDDATEARRSFATLAETGKVVQPLFEAPWGALFGVVIDEFGVSWMFNAQSKKPS